MMRRIAFLFLLLLCLVQSPRAFAVTIGQMDTFEDGTTDGWLVGLLGAPHPAPPQNIASGGPSGAADNYLQLTAVGGAGAGNRLSAINLDQWAGDYIGAGVNAIAMDLNNLGTTDLSLRLLLWAGVAGPPTDVAISTTAVFLPAGSGWTSVLFPIMSDDLTILGGSVTNALTNTTELRLFHSPTIAFPGPSVATTLGVDNIQARGVPPGSGSSTVPEPSTAVLVGTGIAALLSRRYWRA